MDLQLPADLEAQLNQLAAAGTNIEEFVTQSILQGIEQHKLGIVLNPGPDHWAYDLTDQELAESVRSCEIGIQQAAKGESVPFEQAMHEIANEIGLDVDQ